MPKFETAINAQTLIEQLQTRNLISDVDRSRIEDFIRDDQLESELPLYLRFLVGVGAFIASLFFLGFLSVSGLVDYDSVPSLLIWGVLFAAAAIGLANIRIPESTVRHTFLVQCSFVSMGIGKILFVAGFARMFRPHEGWGVFIATLIVSAATYHIYRLSIDRFLSTFAVFNSLFFNLLSDRYLAGMSWLLLNVLLLGLVLLGAAIFCNSRTSRAYTPMGYSVICSLGLSILTLSYWRELGPWDQRFVFSLGFLNILLSGALLALIGWVAGDNRKLTREPLSVAVMGAIILGVISATGVIYSIGLMILGHAKHERLLVIIGMLCMPLFLILYYYNLNVDLMSKSIILIGTGLMLLAGRFYMDKRLNSTELLK